MNRQEFMRELEYLLAGIPEQERLDALAYYNDYFEEAGSENEQRVIQELVSPEQVAKSILEDVRQAGYSSDSDYKDAWRNYDKSTYNVPVSYEKEEKKSRLKGWQIVLIVILLVLTFPIWIGIVAGLFGGLVGLLGGLFGLLVGMIGASIGLAAGGAMCLIGGMLALFANPMEGFTSMGIGALLLAFGIVLALFFILLVFLLIPKLVKALISWIKSLFHRNEGGDVI